MGAAGGDDSTPASVEDERAMGITVAVRSFVVTAVR